MKKTITVRVKIGDEVYEIDSNWSQETEEFCERIILLVKKFVNDMTGKPTLTPHDS